MMRSPHCTLPWTHFYAAWPLRCLLEPTFPVLCGPAFLLRAPDRTFSPLRPPVRQHSRIHQRLISPKNSRKNRASLSPCLPMISTMSSSPSLAVMRTRMSKKVKREYSSHFSFIHWLCLSSAMFPRPSLLHTSLWHPLAQHEADPTKLIARRVIAKLAGLRCHGRVRFRARR